MFISLSKVKVAGFATDCYVKAVSTLHCHRCFEVAGCLIVRVDILEDVVFALRRVWGCDYWEVAFQLLRSRHANPATQL
jgi:hypothetical protein